MDVCRGQEEVAVRGRFVILAYSYLAYECLGCNSPLGSHEEEWTG